MKDRTTAYLAGPRYLRRQRPSTIEQLGPRPPQDLDAERSVLGAVLLNDHALNAAIEKLKPEDFFLDHHRRIFRHMIEMGEAKIGIDLLTLSDHLHHKGELEAAGGGDYIAQLVDGVPRVTVVAHLPHWAAIIREKALLRNLIYAAHAIQQAAIEAEENPSELIERARIAIEELRSTARDRSWEDKFHTVDQLPEGDVSMLINDFLPEGVTFLGARTGDGKTWLALAISRALTKGRQFLGVCTVPQITPVIYLVPEMNAKAFRRRCERFQIGGQFFRCMTISDGTPCDLSDPVLLTAIRELKPVVILDTAIRFSTGEDENSAADTAQGLAKAIFELIHAGTRAVICLHHRSKDAARADEMTLENVLRGSGDLAAICDAVWGLQVDRGDGSAAYLKQSKALVRLQLRCVKARDFRPPEDFRIQLDPFIDQINDMAMLTDKPADESEVDRLEKAIIANPQIEKKALQELTGVGKNRQEKLAAKRGWTFNRKTKWTRGQP